MEFYYGNTICPKLAIGKVFLYRKKKISIPERHISDTQAEIARFQAARLAAISQLDVIWKKAVAEAGADDAAVFFFHKMLLNDAEYQDTVQKIIREERQNAEYAVTLAKDRLAKRFERMEDPYMRARAADIVDISDRLLAMLDAAPTQETPGTAKRIGAMRDSDCRKAAEKDTVPRFDPPECSGNCQTVAASSICRFGADGQPLFAEPVILVTDELAPSEAVLLDKSKILAFVTRRGSADSHASILTRSMGIPAVTGIDFQEDWDGRMAIVDGDNGIVIIDPEPDYLDLIHRKVQAGC